MGDLYRANLLNMRQRQTLSSEAGRKPGGAWSDGSQTRAKVPEPQGNMLPEVAVREVVRTLGGPWSEVLKPGLLERKYTKMAAMRTFLTKTQHIRIFVVGERWYP